MQDATKEGKLIEEEAQYQPQQTQALTVRADPSNLVLAPVMDLTVARQRLKEFQSFVRDYLVKDEDFGVIPGTAKPALLKPGADKLCELYGLADVYKITSRVEDWSRNLFDYEIECTLLSKRDGSIVSTGLGSCNSFEGRYRWRDAQRKCPECSKATIIKGKEEFGGGWLCFKKKGGCGAKFQDGDSAIEKQTVGRVENEDLAALKNTVLKMAKKRSKIDATLGATRSSGVFTQDILEEDHHYEERHEPQQQQAQIDPKKIAEDIVTTKNQIIKLMELPVFTDEQRSNADWFLAEVETKEPAVALDQLSKKLLQVKQFVQKSSKDEAKKQKQAAKSEPAREPEQQRLSGDEPLEGQAV